MQQQDRTLEIQEQVCSAYAEKQALRIQCGNSKHFYGERIAHGETLSLAGHSGIIEYEPAELVVSVRAGTPLRLLLQALAAEGQTLAFEPPLFAEQASVGGCVATGLSGPARPFHGAVRDHLLGCQILNGKGELLRFGGKVIKNVAGYDVSRLMSGALGTLGVLLEVSLKTVPLAEQEITLAVPARHQEALDIMCARAAKPLSLTGLAYDGEVVMHRLAGSEAALRRLRRKLAGEEISSASQWWQEIREQEHYFFHSNEPLWRLSLAPATLPLDLPGHWLYDWGGALRWLQSSAPAKHIRDAVAAEGGHACLFRNEYSEADVGVFHPLPEALLQYHRRIKAAFDPANILNPGRLYPQL